SGVIFGLAPALQAGRLNLNHALNQDGRGSTGSGERARTRRLLVIAEFALSFVLMIAAGLLLHSFWDLLSARLRFTPQSVMSVRTRLPYPNDASVDFFFSSRRRHTRWPRDWSSDVCSSDLDTNYHAGGCCRDSWYRRLHPAPTLLSNTVRRSEERRVGKECRSRWAGYH